MPKRRPLETWYENEIDEVCRYCGAKADCVDHAYPVSLLQKDAAVNGWKSIWDVPFSTRVYVKAVSACSECNGVLSNKRILGIPARRKHVKDRLRRKYQRYLQRISWSDEELDELGDSLRVFIENDERFAKWIRERMK